MDKLTVNARAFADYGNWNDFLQYSDGEYRDQIDDRKAALAKVKEDQMPPGEQANEGETYDVCLTADDLPEA